MQEEQYLKLIESEFHDLDWNHHRFLSHGWEHDVVILDDQYVFRFPKSEIKYKLNRIDLEPRLMEILSKHISLAIPKYEWIAQDQSFAGYRIIGGKPLSASRFHRNLDQRIRTSIASELAQFLSEMHSVSCQEVTDLGFPLMDRHESFQSFYHNFKMHVNPRLNQTEQNVAEKYFSELEKVSTSKFRRVVTHRDLLPDHIFIRNDLKGLSGIIDFSDAGVDDPAIDFAGLWAYGKKFVTAVFEQYKDALDSSLLHRSMIYSLRIPFWMMLDPFMYGRGDFNKGYTEFHKRVVRISQKALLQGWYESI